MPVLRQSDIGLLLYDFPGGRTHQKVLIIYTIDKRVVKL